MKLLSVFFAGIIAAGFAVVGTSGLTGCAQIKTIGEKIAGDRITALQERAADASELLAAVLSDEELAEIRAALSSLDDIDLSKLGTDDSKLWMAYLRVREVVRNHYARTGEPIPRKFTRFNSLAEKIHQQLPVVVTTTRAAKRLVSAYKLLAL